MFETFAMAPPDPILGLSEAFKADQNPNKINLGVGVYQSDEGATPTLACVRAAEARLLEKNAPKTYLAIEGAAAYGQRVQALLFGADSEVLESARAQTAHTPGGTGALRVAADFLAQRGAGARIWVSDPTWANHDKIFAAAGLEVRTYPYYDAQAKKLDFERMTTALRDVPSGDVVLFHGCCHNPSGMDPSREQWRALAEIATERGFLSFFDLAYQGFGDGIAEDAFSVRTFATAGRELLIASSFSKTFGLYNERVGALTLVGNSSDSTVKAFSHVKASIRANYSNPPAHGAAVVTTVLTDAALARMWESEVAEMRDRIHAMRRSLVDTLAAKGARQDFSFITTQRGMFSFAGLSADQVATLRAKHSIYIVGSGRINVAGITTGNIDRLCSAIVSVLPAEAARSPHGPGSHLP